GDDAVGLEGVIHDALVVRLAIGVPVTAVAQAEIVPQLMHERPALLVGGAGVVGRSVELRDQPPAPQRYHQVVAADLGAAGRRVAGARLVVDEERVVEAKALRVDRVDRVGAGTFGGGPEARRRWRRRGCEGLRLEGVEVGVTGDGRRRAGQEGGRVDVRDLL